MLEDLSVIIPTYEKQEFALRTALFWENTGATVFILDGSKKNNDFRDRLQNKYFIRYFHKPLSLSSRFKWFLKSVKIKTKYSILQSDDEFYLPSAIKKCIREIEKKNLASCGGKCICFRKHFDDVLFSPWQPPFCKQENYSVMNKDPEKRLVQHMNPYLCSSIYSVVKTPVFINCLKAASFRSKCIEVPEIAFEVLSAWQGQNKIISDLFWLKSYENPSIGKKLKDRYESFAKWCLQETIEYNKLLAFLTKIIKKVDSSISDNKIKAALKTSLSLYIKNETNHRKTLSKKEKIRLWCLNKYYKVIPRFVQRFAKNIKDKILIQKYKTLSKNTLKKCFAGLTRSSLLTKRDEMHKILHCIKSA